MLPPTKPCAAGTHRALDGLWHSAALLLGSPFCGAQCAIKAKKNSPANLSGFPCAWENPYLPRDAEQAEDTGRNEYTVPSHPEGPEQGSRFRATTPMPRGLQGDAGGPGEVEKSRRKAGRRQGSMLPQGQQTAMDWGQHCCNPAHRAAHQVLGA